MIFLMSAWSSLSSQITLCERLKHINGSPDCGKYVNLSLIIPCTQLPNSGPMTIDMSLSLNAYQIKSVSDGATVSIDPFVPGNSLITSQPQSYHMNDETCFLTLEVTLVRRPNSTANDDIRVDLRSGDGEILIHCSHYLDYDFVEVGIEGARTNLSDYVSPNGPLNSPDDALDESQFIKIKGEVVVDIDYTFWSTEIVADPGAVLSVRANRDVRITKNSSAIGCNSMWEGMVVQESGILRMDNILVKDALNGVYLVDGARFGAYFVEFVDNIHGIFFEDVQSYGDQSSTQIVPPNIEQQQGDALIQLNFRGTDQMLPPYPNQSLYYEKPYVGILVNDMDRLKLFGSRRYRVAQNNFTNMYNGIIAYNSNLLMDGNRFTDIRRGPPEVSGNGIYLRGDFEGNLDYSGEIRVYETPYDFENSMSSIYDFNNCYTAIKLIFADSEIRKAIITNSEIGIKSIHSRNRSFIHSNYLATKYRAIDFEGNYRFGAHIFNNYLSQQYLNTPTSFSFGISGFNATGLYRAINIHNNEIISKNYSTVLLVNSNNVNVENNNHYRISRPGSFSDGLINLIGGGQHNISCNLIDASDVKSDGLIKGVHLRGSNLNNIECNKIYVNWDGININGMSDASILKGNDISSDLMDLTYGTSPDDALAFTGDQPMVVTDPNHGNAFRSSNTLQAVHYSDKKEVVERSKYFVDPTIGSHDPRNNQGDRWFKPRDFDTYYCAPDACEEVILTPLIPEIGNELYDRIRDADLYHGDFSDEVVYTGRAHLYELLRNRDKIPEAYVNFYHDMRLSPMGQLADVRSRMRKLNALDEDQVNLLNEMINERKSLNEEWRLAFYDEESVNNVELSEINEQIDNVQAKIRAIQNASMQQRQSELTSLNTDLHNILPTNIMEENELLYANIYFRYLSSVDVSLGKSDIADLKELSYQCSTSGGDGVLRARALWLAVSEDEIVDFPDDAELCGNKSIANRQKNIKETSDYGQGLIRPNPAADIIQIEGTVTLVRIFNMDGRLMISSKIEDGQINVSDLTSGIYFVEITDHNQDVSVQKLHIID